jgi:DNA-binding NtrC family response regulator
MIVDDDADVLEMLQRLLRLEGYEAEGFADPLAAVEAMRAEPFHIVLADIRMPQMSGIRLLREVRAVNPMCAVIMLTGYSSMGNVVECLEAGAADYFTKPLNAVEELLGAVRYARDKIIRWRNAIRMGTVAV